MTVIDMIRQHLIDAKHDGLWNPDAECACEINDLAPCGDIQGNCEGGIKIACERNGCDWYIVRPTVEDSPTFAQMLDDSLPCELEMSHE